MKTTLTVLVLMHILVLSSGKILDSFYTPGINYGVGYTDSPVAVFSHLHHPEAMASIVSHPALSGYNHTDIMTNMDPLYHNKTLMRIANPHRRTTRSIELQALKEFEIELEVVLKLLPLIEAEGLETHAGIINELEIDLPGMSEEHGRSLTNNLLPLVNKIESAMTMMGFDGRACVLRAICEMSSAPNIQPLGISGEMLHVLLRYFISSEYSDNYQENELDGNSKRGVYIDAGHVGRTGNTCSSHYPTCPVSVFNLATHPKC